MNYILELNGLYFIGNKNDGRIISEDNDLEWCKMWVLELNDNPSREQYLTEKNPC